MLPNATLKAETFEELSFITPATKTWRIDFDTNRIAEVIDEMEALKQAIYCILRTERYRFLIHSRDHGIELDDLFGKGKQYVLPVLGKRITDALIQDDRITAISDFKFSYDKNKYRVSFVVDTIYDDKITIADKVVM